MLIISRQQLAALDAARLDRFRRLLYAHLGEVLPDSVANRTEPAVMTAIDDAVAVAQRTFGLSSERDVARFVALVFALGREFPDERGTAWTGALLRDRELEPPARVDRVFSDLERSHPTLAALWKAWRA